MTRPAIERLWAEQADASRIQTGAQSFIDALGRFLLAAFFVILFIGVWNLL